MNAPRPFHHWTTKGQKHGAKKCVDCHVTRTAHEIRRHLYVYTWPDGHSETMAWGYPPLCRPVPVPTEAP